MVCGDRTDTTRITPAGELNKLQKFILWTLKVIKNDGSNKKNELWLGIFIIHRILKRSHKKIFNAIEKNERQHKENLRALRIKKQKP